MAEPFYFNQTTNVLSWTPEEGAVAYEVQVSPSGDIPRNWDTVYLGPNTSTLITEPAGTYVSHVRVKKGGVWGVYGAEWFFEKLR